MGDTAFSRCSKIAFKPNKNILIFVGGIGSLYVAYKTYSYYVESQRRKKWNAVSKNVVLLHQPIRGKFTPSISPFPLKLETYLRLSNIPYENDFEVPMSPTGKTPWITLNGEDFYDSQLILEMLAKKFHKDFSTHLSQEECAVARALQIMMEEHFYWAAVLWRWVYTGGRSIPDIGEAKLLLGLFAMVSKMMKRAAYGQGMGRHTKAEVVEMGLKDLRSLSSFLGVKPYFMGDKATEVDCAMFGILAEVVWNSPQSPFEELVNSECINLKEFCLRMKETFWPDWDRCLQPLIL